MQHGDGPLKKLTCSASNKHRPRGGVVSHYCDYSHAPFFICRDIDAQMSERMHSIQIEKELLPRIHRMFKKEVEERLRKVGPDAISSMKARFDQIEHERERVTRQYAAGRVTDELFEKLARGWDDQQSPIIRAIDSQSHDVKRFVTDLETALQMLTIIGSLYDRLEPTQRRNLLRNLVHKVIITPQGKIANVILQRPFAYIQCRLAATGAKGNQGFHGENKNQPSDRTSGARAGSTDVTLYGPNEIQSEPLGSLPDDSLISYFESIEYPQRFGLERLLTGTL